MAKTQVGPNTKPLHRMKLHVKTGDTVRILTGNDRDKTGKVVSVDREKRRVVVEGINLHKRFKKGPQKGQGEILDVPMPLAAANVMLVCPSCGATTRTGAGMEGEKKVRVCKKCQAIV
ncbi:MAG TPA: 50S ribosomal protein L24 [bacterium]|nr:50S ribosomal protein L24 [bacterium]